MPDLPSRVDYFRIGGQEVLARSGVRPPGQRLDAAQVYLDGADINLITASASAMAEEVTRQLALAIRALFLSGAEAEDLDRLVADRFSPYIARKQASPAVAVVTFTRSSGALAAISLPIGFLVRSESGIEFATTALVTLPALSNGPVSVTAQAVVAGLSGNVTALSITEIATQPPPDPALQVSNSQPATGGDDTESDDRLRSRARDFFRQARRGTLGAIEFGALTVTGIRQATAVEFANPDGNPSGQVDLYVADAQGQANAALVSAVVSALVEYRAAGVVVNVSGAVPLFVPVVYRLRFTAGVDTVAAFQSVRLATVSAVNSLAPNATLPVSLLFQTARTIPGVIVLDDAIVSPVGDLVPTAGQVLRTRADLVTETA